MRAACILAFGLAGLCGCAYGGGGRAEEDAGRRDGGGIRLLDSGPRPRPDAAVGRDAGPPRTDAGGGGSCTETPCRLVSPQCGCAAGQGCYLAGGSRVCGMPGPEAEGEACSGATSCQAGNLCIGGGFCAHFCESDADCRGGAGSICIIQIDDGTGSAVPGVTLCSVSCTPTSGAGCPSSMGCEILQESMGAMRTFTSCRPAGTGSAGSPCTTSDDCRAGYFCADPGTGNECIRLCRLPAGSECSGFETCTAFGGGSVTVGGVEYGYCR